MFLATLTVCINLGCNIYTKELPTMEQCQLESQVIITKLTEELPLTKVGYTCEKVGPNV